ncbi:YncE family protein, partial [Rhizobium johnstonii]|uniref:YncE family protein n=1 Tax=Rhizobium johnstonii TaxID=3019933 RepID=UPI003F95D0B2
AGIAVDPVRHVLYVAENTNYTVSAYDIHTGSRLAVMGTGNWQPCLLAFDSIHGSLWISHYGMHDAGDPNLTVVDAITLGVRGTVTLPGSAHGLAVDPTT